MQSTELRERETKASICVALLSFAVAAFALCQGKAGLVALIAVSCGFSLIFVRLRQEREFADARLGLDHELTRARELFDRGAYRHALGVAHDVAEQAQSARVQRASIELCAWCELGTGRPQAARDALSWVGGFPELDPYCVAAVEDACGESLWALHILERAARKRTLAREAVLFRIDLYARLRSVEAACALTVQQLHRLRGDDAERVLAFARTARVEHESVQALALALTTAHRPCP
jgi:hypothetical protein